MTAYIRPLVRFKWSVAALAILCAGCERRPNQVHFIVPDNYSGSFYIELNGEDGVEIPKVDGSYVVTIPESGIFKMKGFYPFGSYLNTAAFASGTPIWVSGRQASAG